VNAISKQSLVVLAKKLGRVAVLMGGDSAEREVSLRSGKAVFEALLEAGVDAVAVDVQKRAFNQLANLQVDRAFNVLHGRGGEDGTMRAVLDFLGIPCTGSNVCASALTMDKVLTKKVIRCSGIETPEFIELGNESDCERLLAEIDLPVFVKPRLEGSSIGMARVNDEHELFPAWKQARHFGDVFAEKFIDGSEYTVAFLGEQILPPIRLETPRDFYDYDAKYLLDDTTYICPCGLDQQRISEMDEIVRRTLAATGASDWGRVDLMVDGEQNAWVLEVNTVPGMTDHSLVPMAARAAGMELPELVLRILQFTIGGGNRDAG